MTYESGRPFTLGSGNPLQIGTTQILSGDSRFRLALEPLNSSQMPSNFQVDLRVDKTVSIFDRLSANIYISVINLFDTRNVTNVFIGTGSATDDGYVTDPANIVNNAKIFGQSFIDAYKAIHIQNADYLYGPSRQIRLGVRLEY